MTDKLLQKLFEKGQDLSKKILGGWLDKPSVYHKLTLPDQISRRALEPAELIKSNTYQALFVFHWNILSSSECTDAAIFKLCLQNKCWLSTILQNHREKTWHFFTFQLCFHLGTFFQNVILSQCWCTYPPIRFRHKSHLVRVKRTCGPLDKTTIK